MRIVATAAVTYTFSFDGINESKEGVYTIRVTQANGSYIDSSKAVLAVLRLGLDGQRLPIETPDDNELAVVPLADRTKWVKVLASTWSTARYWRENATPYQVPSDMFLPMWLLLHTYMPFGITNVYYFWVTEEEYLAASTGKTRILQEDGTYLEIPTLNIGQDGQGLYTNGTYDDEVRYGLTRPSPVWPPLEQGMITEINYDTGAVLSMTWAEAYERFGFEHPDLDTTDLVRGPPP